MQVKKYEAPTMSEALKLVKAELGPDAIILSTKKHRKGFGLLSKASVEITAAVSERSLSKKKITERLIPTETRRQIDKLSADKQQEVYEKFSNHYENKTKNTPAENYGRNAKFSQADTLDNIQSEAKPVERPAAAVASKLTDTVLRDEVARLKQMMEELRTEHSQMNDSKIPDNSTEQAHSEFQNLLRNGLDKRLASTLIKQVTFSLPRSATKDSEAIIEGLAVEMMNAVKTQGLLNIKPSDPQKVLAFVGTTGVGKTTTIAKIASLALRDQKIRVGIISFDFGFSSVDVMSTYAKLLNVPYRSVSTVSELDRALVEFKPLGLVLVDTAGCSQKDSDRLSQMKEIFSETPSLTPILVVSATTRDQELNEITSRFKAFNPVGLIITKLDETSTFGCVYNLAVRTNLPLNYFGVGQKVPEDIEQASKERVASLILDL